MGPIIEEVSATTAVGMETYFIPLPSPDFNGVQVISKLWPAFMERRGEIAATIGATCFGVTVADGALEESGKMRYVACVAVQEGAMPPPGMVKIAIPAGKYAIFTHKGNVRNIPDTMRYIYETWLPAAKVTLRAAPHLERYDHRSRPDADESVCDICVPIL